MTIGTDAAAASGRGRLAFTFAVRFRLAHNQFRFVTMFRSVLFGHASLYGCDYRLLHLLAVASAAAGICRRRRHHVSGMVILMATLWIRMVARRLSLLGMRKGVRVPEVTL